MKKSPMPGSVDWNRVNDHFTSLVLDPSKPAAASVRLLPNVPRIVKKAIISYDHRVVAIVTVEELASGLTFTMVIDPGMGTSTRETWTIADGKEVGGSAKPGASLASLVYARLKTRAGIPPLPSA